MLTTTTLEDHFNQKDGLDENTIIKYIDTETTLRSIYGDDLYDRMQDCNVLVVGAGGIGCELLKSLAISGFRKVEVVDLDVIELSNLHRQFLFKQHHIGKSKALVAKESIERMNPNMNIVAHQASIKNLKKFPLQWWSKFDIVLSALDNADARSHVNGMCQAIGKTVVESGTAGFLGQTSVIVPKKTACFDCRPRQPTKTFPVCTIRTTPSALIHCVVWAKDFLFPNLFGRENVEFVKPSEDEHADETVLSNLHAESRSFQDLRLGALDESFGRDVFLKVFGRDIVALLSLPDLWTDRRPPVPMSEVDVPQQDQEIPSDENIVWSIQSWIQLFLQSAHQMAQRTFAGPSFTEQFFDKDDDETLDFVTSAANIRAHIFGIPMNSRFELKAMAGNIIPAIATTNAIAAALIVIQAQKILGGKVDGCRTTFITHGSNRKNLFVNQELEGPNPECATCNVHRVTLTLPCASTNLSFIVNEIKDKIIREFAKNNETDLEVEEMTVMENTRILYDPDLDTNLSKTLFELDIGDSQFLRMDIPGTVPFIIAIQEGVSNFETDFLDEERVKARLNALNAPKLCEKRKHDSEDDIIEGESDIEVIETDSKRVKV